MMVNLDKEKAVKQTGRHWLVALLVCLANKTIDSANVHARYVTGSTRGRTRSCDPALSAVLETMFTDHQLSMNEQEVTHRRDVRYSEVTALIVLPLLRKL